MLLRRCQHKELVGGIQNALAPVEIRSLLRCLYRRLSRIVGTNKLSRTVVDDVGYPIILDAGSNMGFGALLFSAFVPIQYIGGLMVFAMVSTSIGTLTVLAALAELLKKRLVKRD